MSLSDELHKINPNLIDFDLFNPRGETVEQIVNDDEFHKLKESIARIGVLVPLIVKKNENTRTNKEFTLIDGERRLRASIDLRLDTVPARIVESDVEGKIIAYQIHQNRKAWSKPSEAKSIQSIINSIKSGNPNISETDLKKELIEITSHKPTAINDILKILKYDDETQEKASRGELEHSYLIRIEDDFIAPIKRVFPEIIDTFGEENLRTIMIHKAELKLLINTRYMMSASFKEMFKPSLYRDKVCNLLVDFIQSPEKSTSDLYSEFQELQNIENAKVPQVVQGQTDSKEKNNSSKENLSENSSQEQKNPPEDKDLSNDTPKGSTPKNEEVSPTSSSNPNRKVIIIPKAKKSGFNAIKESLEDIGKQYSEEELEYIKEAIVCLGSEKALKAAVLMIWSSSISRILKFIEKDIPNFNNSSETMHKERKSFYKFYSSTFQKNATTIDEIKEQARDMQLICYLCYQKIITQSQFKQLKGHYDIRNECAHPTSLVLSMNEVLAIFENLIKFIFNNPKLNQ